MVRIGHRQHSRGRTLRRRIVWQTMVPCAMLLGVGGCHDGGTPVAAVAPQPAQPAVILPVGRLTQAAAAAPIVFTTLSNWRVEIAGGNVTVKPPTTTGANLLYTSRGTRELLGTQELRSWNGDRRSLLLPGGAKLTMRATGSQLLSIALYDGDESHEVNVATQTILHSQISASVATTRETAEYDGETGHMILRPFPTVASENVFLANLYTQGVNTDGSVRAPVNAVQAIGRQFASEVVPFPDTAPTLPAEFDVACVADATARGGLTRAADSSLVYTTRSGLWRVTIDQSMVTIARVGAPATAKMDFDIREFLNGKHIKNFDGTVRTVLLPDGSKITMESDAATVTIKATSIYDAGQSHEIGNAGNVVRHSCVNATVATQRDTAQADGETAVLWNPRAPAAAAGNLLYMDIYVEQTGTGGVVSRTYNPYYLGETGDPVTNPTQVIDFYDDPRLAAT